jgi:hypothetical protein
VSRSGNRTQRRGRGPEPERYVYDGESRSAEEWDAARGWSRGRFRKLLAAKLSPEQILSPTAAPSPNAPRVWKKSMKVIRPLTGKELVRRRLEAIVAENGTRLVVKDITFCEGRRAGWRAETNLGTHWARFVDGKLVIRKESFEQ